MFQTKSEEKDEIYHSKTNRKFIPNIEDHTSNSQLQNVESNEASHQCSELENSQLKQTADFFNPIENSEISNKRFSFGLKKKESPINIKDGKKNLDLNSMKNCIFPYKISKEDKYQCS